MQTQTITPFLWYDHQAEEAANFYVSVFSSRRGADSGRGPSKVVDVTRYGEAGPGTSGTVMTVEFQLDGQEFTALNGGKQPFTFNESISFVVNCKTQDEVDELWAVLTKGGEEGPCGWLKDRYGLSWQIVPTRLTELLTDSDPGRAQRAMKAMLEMKKIDIATLERAADAA
jgi:predicted 3-demethylubiquinone-9 3-methyltransferase (glyoxalase superfamily)